MNSVLIQDLSNKATTDFILRDGADYCWVEVGEFSVLIVRATNGVEVQIFAKNSIGVTEEHILDSACAYTENARNEKPLLVEHDDKLLSWLDQWAEEGDDIFCPNCNNRGAVITQDGITCCIGCGWEAENPLMMVNETDDESPLDDPDYWERTNPEPDTDYDPEKDPWIDYQDLMAEIHESGLS